jgi:hypothetical protein
MARRLGFVRGSLLAVLPMGAFFVGPAVSAFAPGVVADRVLLSALPTFLPLLALCVVCALAYRWTRSAKTAALLTAAALAVTVVAALAYLVAVWPTGG